jgi:hypothetical protein
VSKTVLSEAFAGKRLPSERTVAAIAHAFGADEGEWTARRRAVVPDAAAGPASGPKRRGFGPGSLVGIAVAALVIGAALGAFGEYGIQRAVPAVAGPAASASVSAAATDAPEIAVKTGTDPAQTRCVDDAKVVASQTETHNTQLQIIYSAACHAAWSRINRYDGKATGNEISTSIYRQIAPNARDRQETTEPDAQSAYTTLIVRPTPQTEICAVGSITLNGQTISLGTPVCM